MADVTAQTKLLPDVGSRATRTQVAEMVAIDNNEMIQPIKDKLEEFCQGGSRNKKGMFVLSLLRFILTSIIHEGGTASAESSTSGKLTIDHRFSLLIPDRYRRET